MLDAFTKTFYDKHKNLQYVIQQIMIFLRRRFF
jgi:hypothetical protein